MAGALPGASAAGWTAGQQRAYEGILGFTPVLLLASFCAYLAGEFLNSFVLARMKIATGGRWLWSRTIGSTFVGEGVDSIIFITIVFGVALGAPLPVLVTLILTQWGFKVLYEIAATPVTYAIVSYL
ncbi:MAG: queuosine precursor transporter, partial [Ktedonobacterales bacterium]|nr:queuosine precursor transporter [Ktedonobacterales bacterium]